MDPRTRTKPVAMIYKAYGRILQSEVPLPELEATGGAAQISIATKSTPLALDPGSLRPLVDEDGGIWIVLAESDGVPVLSFPGVVDCAIDLAALRISCHPAPGADHGAVQHALVDHVIPRVMVATGGTVLHASAVVVDGSAMLFAGPSGAGKSTLAARCAEAGHPLIADDAVALEEAGGRWHAHVSYPGLRLWPESVELLARRTRTRPITSGSPKHRVDAPGRVAASVSYDLAEIALIARRPGRPMAQRLLGTQAFSRLWATLFGWPGLAGDRALLARVAALAETAVVLEVGFDTDTPVEDVLAAVRAPLR